jgi:hypothetical protein
MVGGLMIGILDSISSLSSGISDNYPVLWLDAALGVNDGTALNGHAVYDWADQSGNGNNFLQGTAVYQPIYNTTGINGLPTLTFYPNKLLVLLNTVLLSTDYTIYAVVKTLATQTGATNYKTFFMFSVAGYYSQTLGKVGFSYDNPNDPTPVPSPKFLYDDRINRYGTIAYDTDPHQFTISNGKVAGVSKKQIYADTVQYWDLPAAIDSSLGLAHYLGSWNNQIGQFEFAELIVYNTKHSDAKREDVELYLKNKYGL